MDLRGHGHSGKPHDRKSYGTELAADVVRLLSHIGATKAHIVGYSLGGLIALDVAALQQEHALSVVVGGTGWPPPAAVDNFRRQAEAFEQGKIPVREGDDAMAWAALLRGLRVLSAEDVHRIKIPLAVVIGADDPFMADAQRLSRAVPTTEVIIIPAANYQTAMGHPKFFEALLAFLLKQRAAPTRAEVRPAQLADQSGDSGSGGRRAEPDAGFGGGSTFRKECGGLDCTRGVN